ncbi:ABC transporter permease [bacterium AH-315-F18]|nr:ABC transporter permease [bacterium AH-315-F18]
MKTTRAFSILLAQNIIRTGGASSTVVYDLYKYRGYIFRTAWVTFTNRYAGSSLSVAWYVAQPLVLILLYVAVFSVILTPELAGPRAAASGGKAMFALYLCAGFLPWMAMTECATFGALSCLTNATYLSKLPIPEHVFVAREAVMAGFTLIISFTLLIMIAFLLGHTPSWSWLLLILPLTLFQVFAFGLALLLSVLNVFFRDIGASLGIAFQLWFWATPIVYPISILPPWLRTAETFNPAWYFLEAVREIFLHHRPPAAEVWLGLSVATAVSLALGFGVFRMLRREIRDNL